MGGVISPSVKVLLSAQSKRVRYITVLSQKRLSLASCSMCIVNLQSSSMLLLIEPSEVCVVFAIIFSTILPQFV